MKKEITVSVTGAAGQIGYALLFRLSSGEIFGKDVLINLKLLELPQALKALEGVRMELDDCAFPNLKSITVTDKQEVAFKDSNWALLVGSVPRKKGMERKDLLNINGGIFTKQGEAIEENAADDCRVLVVGNPCNTNCLIAKSRSNRIPKRNFFAMTALDEQRAISQLASKSNFHNSTISNMTIWGNHSSTQYPDFTLAKINGAPATETIKDENWLKNDFISTVQQRGAAIIEARGASSAASAASAALLTVKNLITPTEEGNWFSVAVSSEVANHAYGIDEDVMFSYPIRNHGNDGTDWKVVPGLEISQFSQEKIDATYKELLEEKEAVSSLL